MLVSRGSPTITDELAAGEVTKVPPNTDHRVVGKNNNRCRFVIVQGIGPHDYISTQNNL